MSITDEGSVLIIGAGASVDFGMPLGGELIDRISHQLLHTGWTYDQNSSGTSKRHYPPYGGNYIDSIKEGSKNHAYAALAWRTYGSSRSYSSNDFIASQEEAISLGKLLQDQTSETIDDFIAQNPRNGSLAKLFIASTFVNKFYTWDASKHQYKLNNISSRYLLRTPERWNNDTSSFEPIRDEKNKHIQFRERNWIHLLINIVRHKIQKDGDLSEKIKIISFNYDGILEKVLSDQFMNTEMLLKMQKEEGKTYEDFFDIVHPHGKCGDLQDTTPNPWKLADEWSENISVVNEGGISVRPRVSLAREEAKIWIKEAQHIYAAGFAFSKPNCDKILNLNANLNCQISYLNFDDDIGLDLGVKNAVNPKVWKNRDHPETPKIIKASGTPSRPLSIANWIKAGHLGTMPG